MKRNAGWFYVRNFLDLVFHSTTRHHDFGGRHSMTPQKWFPHSKLPPMLSTRPSARTKKITENYLLKHTRTGEKEAEIKVDEGWQREKDLLVELEAQKAAVEVHRAQLASRLQTNAALLNEPPQMCSIFCCQCEMNLLYSPSLLLSNPKIQNIFSRQ